MNEAGRAERDAGAAEIRARIEAEMRLVFDLIERPVPRAVRAGIRLPRVEAGEPLRPPRLAN